MDAEIVTQVNPWTIAVVGLIVWVLFKRDTDRQDAIEAAKREAARNEQHAAQIRQQQSFNLYTAALEQARKDSKQWQEENHEQETDK